MNKELQDYYENRFEMLSTQGWKDLMVDIETIIKATNQVNNINDEKQLFFRKGELSAFQWLLGVDQMSHNAYEELQNANTE